jgi:hypothetical protein
MPLVTPAQRRPAQGHGPRRWAGPSLEALSLSHARACWRLLHHRGAVAVSLCSPGGEGRRSRRPDRHTGSLLDEVDVAHDQHRRRQRPGRRREDRDLRPRERASAALTARTGAPKLEKARGDSTKRALGVDLRGRETWEVRGTLRRGAGQEGGGGVAKLGWGLWGGGVGWRLFCSHIDALEHRASAAWSASAAAAPGPPPAMDTPSTRFSSGASASASSRSTCR